MSDRTGLGPLETAVLRTVNGVMYFLYLVAVFLPQFSLPRILMPLTPLLGSATFTATPTRQRAWLITAAAMQPAGIALIWFLSYP